MAEQIHTITAGDRPVYEIVYAPDAGTVTIRHAEGTTEEPQEIVLMASVAGTLSEQLAAVHRKITQAGK